MSNDSSPPHHRTVVVTGGSSGIGLACARHFRSAGDRVVIVARNRERLERVAAELNVEYFSADTADLDALTAIRDEIGQVDLLIHGAGVLKARRFRRQSPDAFEATVRANLMTAYTASAAFVPAMPSGAKVILLASTAGIDAGMYLTAYAASKAAVLTMAASMRTELEPDGIGVHVVLPGTVDTEMMEVTEVERAALHVDDVVSAIAWLADLSPRVRVDELIMRPVENSPFTHTVVPREAADATTATTTTTSVSH